VKGLEARAPHDRSHDLALQLEDLLEQRVNPQDAARERKLQLGEAALPKQAAEALPMAMGTAVKLELGLLASEVQGVALLLVLLVRRKVYPVLFVRARLQLATVLKA